MRRFCSLCVTLMAVTVFCLVGWTDGSAQPTVELGVKGGLGLAKLRGSQLEGIETFNEDLGDGFRLEGEILTGIGDRKAGFVGGIYAMVHATPRFGVRVEALYSMKGAKGNISGDADVYDASNQYVATIDLRGKNTLTLNYFEIPLLGVASFPAGTNGTFDVFAGPGFSFKSKAELKIESTASYAGQSQTATQTSDIGDEVKGTDVGGIFGAGFSYRLASAFLFAEGRWALGFTKIDNSGGGVDWKNSAFGIQAGLGIPLTTAQ